MMDGFSIYPFVHSHVVGTVDCIVFTHCFYIPCSLLFPGQPDRVVELFRLSGVDETLRPQQLTLEHFKDLTFCYRTILGNLSSVTTS